jgi:hypothetical protein
MDVRRMMIGWATIFVCMLNSGMPGLNSLLREWEIAARNGVEISLFGNLRLHFVLLG